MHPSYRQHRGLLSPLVDRWRAKVIAGCLPPGISLLDLGCGPALLLQYLKPPRFYMGLDHDPDVIRANQSLYTHLTFLHESIERASEAISQRFDALVMGAVLEHLEKSDRVLWGLRNCLAPGGRLYLTTPTPRGGKVHAQAARLGLLSREASEDHKDFFGRPKLSALLDAGGWKMREYREFQFGMNQLVIASPE